LSKQDVRVTIRLLPEKADVYEDFKKLVTERLHSDVCYVTTMLLESFTNAVNETPNLEDPISLNFVKQNIQINMGCAFNYYTKKARRTPQDVTGIVTDSHNLLPDILNQYPDMNLKAREFWFKEFQSQGLIPNGKDPYVSTGKQKHKHFFKKRLREYCMTFVIWLKRWVKR